MTDLNNILGVQQNSTLSKVLDLDKAKQTIQTNPTLPTIPTTSTSVKQLQTAIPSNFLFNNLPTTQVVSSVLNPVVSETLKAVPPVNPLFSTLKVVTTAPEIFKTITSTSKNIAEYHFENEDLLKERKEAFTPRYWSKVALEVTKVKDPAKQMAIVEQAKKLKTNPTAMDELLKIDNHIVRKVADIKPTELIKLGLAKELEEQKLRDKEFDKKDLVGKITGVVGGFVGGAAQTLIDTKEKFLGEHYNKRISELSKKATDKIIEEYMKKTNYLKYHTPKDIETLKNMLEPLVEDKIRNYIDKKVKEYEKNPVDAGLRASLSRVSPDVSELVGGGARTLFTSIGGLEASLVGRKDIAKRIGKINLRDVVLKEMEHNTLDLYHKPVETAVVGGVAYGSGAVLGGLAGLGSKMLSKPATGVVSKVVGHALTKAPAVVGAIGLYEMGKRSAVNPHLFSKDLFLSYLGLKGYKKGFELGKTIGGELIQSPDFRPENMKLVRQSVDQSVVDNNGGRTIRTEKYRVYTKGGQKTPYTVKRIIEGKRIIESTEPSGEYTKVKGTDIITEKYRIYKDGKLISEIVGRNKIEPFATKFKTKDLGTIVKNGAKFPIKRVLEYEEKPLSWKAIATESLKVAQTPVKEIHKGVSGTIDKTKTTVSERIIRDYSSLKQQLIYKLTNKETLQNVNEAKLQLKPTIKKTIDTSNIKLPSSLLNKESKWVIDKPDTYKPTKLTPKEFIKRLNYGIKMTPEYKYYLKFNKNIKNDVIPLLKDFVSYTKYIFTTYGKKRGYIRAIQRVKPKTRLKQEYLLKPVENVEGFSPTINPSQTQMISPLQISKTNLVNIPTELKAIPLPNMDLMDINSAEITTRFVDGVFSGVFAPTLILNNINADLGLFEETEAKNLIKSTNDIIQEQQQGQQQRIQQNKQTQKNIKQKQNLNTKQKIVNINDVAQIPKLRQHQIPNQIMVPKYKNDNIVGLIPKPEEIHKPIQVKTPKETSKQKLIYTTKLNQEAPEITPPIYPEPEPPTTPNIKYPTPEPPILPPILLPEIPLAPLFAKKTSKNKITTLRYAPSLTAILLGIRKSSKENPENVNPLDVRGV